MIDLLSFITMFVLPGMVGGTIRGPVGMAKHVHVSGEKVDVRKFLLSLAAAIVTGAVAVAVTAGDWKIGILAGFAGSDLIESLYKSRLLGLLK